MASVVGNTAAHEAQDTESEYEYEYENTATETYFVDVDISSVHEAQTKRVVNESSQRAIPNPFQAQNAQEEGSQGSEFDAEAPNGLKSLPASSKEGNLPRELQILELDSNNPVVLYDSQIYGCTWHDLIGTNMFFSEHGGGLDLEPLVTDGDADLLGMSRIKLVARKAHLVPKRESQKRGKEEEERLKPVRGSGLGALSTSNPKINADMKKQAKFLERLMDVKQAKGEIDDVRTIQPVRKRNAQSPTGRDKPAKHRKGQMWDSRRVELKGEIQHRNRLALRGNPDALERLEEIYGLLDDDDDNNDDDDEPNIVAAPQPGVKE